MMGSAALLLLPGLTQIAALDAYRWRERGRDLNNYCNYIPLIKEYIHAWRNLIDLSAGSYA